MSTNRQFETVVFKIPFVVATRRYTYTLPSRRTLAGKPRGHFEANSVPGGIKSLREKHNCGKSVYTIKSERVNDGLGTPAPNKL
jgi:hypothetical protein